MSNNSNQTGALLLLAIGFGIAVYSFKFFGTELENKNVSASFGQFSNSKSVNLYSNNKKTAKSGYEANEIRSDLSGVSLPSTAMKTTLGGTSAQYSSPDFNTTNLTQVDVNDMDNSAAEIRTNTKVSYANNSSQSILIGNSDVDYISNTQNPTTADMNGLLLLDTRAAETAMTGTQGSKRATPALKGKTAVVSSSLASKGPKKVDGAGGAGEPMPGGSLPVGDGAWILISLLGVYAATRFVIRA